MSGRTEYIHFGSGNVYLYVKLYSWFLIKLLSCVLEDTASNIGQETVYLGRGFDTSLRKQTKANSFAQVASVNGIMPD